MGTKRHWAAAGLAGAASLAKKRYMGNGSVNLTKIADDYRKMNLAAKSIVKWANQTATGRPKKPKVSSPGILKKRGGKLFIARKRLSGAQTSKSRGFLRTRRGTRNSFNKFTQKGVCCVRESGGAQENTPGVLKPQCVYIGHTTWNPADIRYMMVAATVKRLFVKAGIPVGGLDSFIPVSSTAGLVQKYKIQIWYKGEPLAAEARTEVDFDATNTSYNSIMTLVLNQIFATKTNDQTQFLKLVLLTFGDGTAGAKYANVLSTVDLTRSKIAVQVKSSLKIQNRTINTAGNVEADDVDNVPLYGRSYEGPGNGVIFNPFRATNAGQTAPNIAPLGTFSSNTIEPIPDNTSAGSLYGYDEPPLANVFTKVSRTGKIHLDPAEIKTSVIFYRKSFYFNQLCNIFYYGSTSPTQGVYRFYNGNYRLFCLEKMLQSVATTSTNKISVHYEVDTKTGCLFIEKSTNVTPFVSYLGNM